MSLKIQIISSLFSFVFGFTFSTFLTLNGKIIYNKYKVIKIIGSFFIVLSSTLIYFIILNKINYSMFHPYHLIMISLGFALHSLIRNKLRPIVKKHKK